MNRITLSAIAVALLALGACSDRDAQTRQATAPSAASPAPPATTPAPTPIPPLPATTGVDAGRTAKDSAATDPKGTLSKEEESKSMPMAGHGNNHSSPSLESKPKP